MSSAAADAATARGHDAQERHDLLRLALASRARPAAAPRHAAARGRSRACRPALLKASKLLAPAWHSCTSSAALRHWSAVVTSLAPSSPGSTAGRKAADQRCWCLRTSAAAPPSTSAAITRSARRLVHADARRPLCAAISSPARRIGVKVLAGGIFGPRPRRGSLRGGAAESSPRITCGASGHVGRMQHTAMDAPGGRFADRVAAQVREPLRERGGRPAWWRSWQCARGRWRPGKVRRSGTKIPGGRHPRPP